MNIRTFITALLVLAANPGLQAQKCDVYVPIPSERIQATASSELDNFPAKNTANGSGMVANYHQADNLGRMMWISNISKVPTRANAHVKQGMAWIMYEFDHIEEGVDFIQIWNHNQNQHTGRGLQKVYIEYSADGKIWSLLRNGQSDHFIIPQAIGRKQEPASLSIETGGIDIRYLCITADKEHGNHYHDDNPATLAKASEMNQNPHYYGLSEVRFYRSKHISLSDIGDIRSFEFKAGQGYVRTADGPKREFSVLLPIPLYTGGTIIVKTSHASQTITIPPSKSGLTRIDATFPAGYMEEEENVTVEFSSQQGNIKRQVNVPAARKWKLYFLPHSHLDIGYTHLQQDVMELQISNLEKAIALTSKTRQYPEGARYKWNAEATWAVDGFLKRYKGTDKERQFIEAVQNGDIGLDATLGSILTGISKQEELMHLFDDAHKISALTGVEINTAMMSDVPGQSWGVVTAMADNGVRYFSSGPNYVPTLGRLGSHGVGLYNLIWGDVPFWWKSQSGTHKILYWQTGKGYSMFHGWLMDRLSVCGVDPVWDYLQELESKEYPYGLTYLRYTIHGDNGPPDEEMSDVIRNWNEKYESPQFLIGTTKELFTEMETVYGDYLPTYSGDMTPIWEDGAASTARELAMNRASAERLNQFEILWSMTQPASEIPREALLEAWKNAVLFSEHTWGAAASGPEPDSKFTKDVWAGKKRYADNADEISKKLFGDLVKKLGIGSEASQINVYNTNLWDRSDIVRIEGVDLTGKQLMSENGEPIPVQKLADGSWVFYAENLKPLSGTSFRIIPTSQQETYSSMVDGNSMQNGRIKIVIDEISGTIKSFTVNGSDHEFVGKEGLNQYVYSDHKGENLQTIAKIKSITLLNDGAVAATFRIESEAPGCESLIRDITIYRNIDRIDIINTVDKLNIYKQENVRFLFPFNIENPEITLDLAMSEIHPEREQLASSNKNFYSILNGLSVANIKQGIYLSTIDAPFVELGSMTADLTRLHKEATGWLNTATVSGDVYSWVMNNRWRTNYKASQEGVAVFRYSMKAFDPYHPDLKRFGMEQAQQLVAVASNNSNQPLPLFRIKGNNRIALSTIRPSADGNGYILRLQNASPFSIHAALESSCLDIHSAYYSDNLERSGKEFNYSSFWMKPYECISIKLTIK